MSAGAHIPLARLIVPLAAGIVLQLTAHFDIPAKTFLYTYLLLSISGILALPLFNDVFSGRWVFGAWVFLFLFIAGYHLSQNHSQISRPDHFSHFHENGGTLLIRLTEPVIEKANSWQVTVEAERLVGDSLDQPVSGRMMLYLEKDSLAAGLRYGDCLLIDNEFWEVQAPRNPGEFNYKRFLALRNIYHQAWLASGNWEKKGGNHGNLVLHWALSLREGAMESFIRNGLGDKELAVVSALVLGYRENLDEELQREFAGAGAMHVLCVSGLHVGIIYLVLNFLLGFLHRFKNRRVIQTSIILLLLWFYAAMTGFSPSVLRATIMFSFVIVGMGLGRPTSVYNNLAASALLLMIIDPWIIAQVGFQMSYLAVLSIVALYPVFYELATIRNPMLEKVWALVCVSLAAQLAIGPLSLYYFHQFPNYFLITNLIAVPLAGLVIYAALGTLLFSAVPLLSFFAGKILYGLVFAMHHSVHFIEGLPFSTLSGLYISLPEMLGLLMVMLFLTLFFSGGYRKMLPLALLGLLLLMGSVSARSIINMQHRAFVVYSVNRGAAMDFILGKKAWCVCCGDQDTGLVNLDYRVAGNRLRMGVKKVIVLQLSDQSDPNFSVASFSRTGPFLKFCDTHLYVLDQDSPKSFSWPGFEIDYLVISRNPRHDPQTVLEYLQPALVIVDGSNYRWISLRWEEICREAGIECWNISQKGAFSVDLIKGNCSGGDRPKAFYSLLAWE